MRELPQNTNNQIGVTMAKKKTAIRKAADPQEKNLSVVSVEDAKKKVSDIVVVGNGDTMQILCKASSEEQGWMKSAKAMEIKSVGCLVQFTTQQRNIDGTYSVAETSSFLPGTKLRPDVNGGMKVVPQNYNGD